MTSTKARCLILACGNTLRGDDGVGLWLAAWAEDRFKGEAAVRVIADHQWTPELAEEVAHAESVLFIDCSVDSAPGLITLATVNPSSAGTGHGTHHLGAAELLGLAQEYYNSLPRDAQLLTIGAASTELAEVFSEPVAAALPEACRMIEETLMRQLSGSSAS